MISSEVKSWEITAQTGDSCGFGSVTPLAPGATLPSEAQGDSALPGLEAKFVPGE